jgi:23S rRNA pseudouridine1911/1915/1917 synthase
MNITIVKETEHWIAVSKPAGIQVERNPFGPSAESLVYDYLSGRTRNPYVGIVHRIDRPTSGLVLIAKKKQMLRRLNQQFSSQDVHKEYLARVAPLPAATSGQLNHWLEKDLVNKKALVHSEEVSGAKYCSLHYKQKQAFREEQGLLHIKPETGRYHQIRAQLSAIGAPVVGDDKYGSTVPYEEASIMLHAWKLEIPAMNIQLETAPPAWAEEKS